MNLLDTRFETPYNTAPFSQLDVDAFLPAFKKAIESAKAEINRTRVYMKTLFEKKDDNQFKVVSRYFGKE